MSSERRRGREGEVDGEWGAADGGEVAGLGADPGVRELPVSRAAGASPDLGTADGRGRSGDQGVVVLGG